MTNEADEIKHIAALENMRMSIKTIGDANNIISFTPELEDAPEHTFGETGKDTLKREELAFTKVNSGKFNITTDFAVHGWSESKDMKCDKAILMKRSGIFIFLLLSKNVHYCHHICKQL